MSTETKEVKAEWRYRETGLAAIVIAGDIHLHPRWSGLASTNEIRAVVRKAAAADALYEAVLALLAVMEMQEGRENEELHISQPEAWHIWTNAKFHARAALALVDGNGNKKP